MANEKTTAIVLQDDFQQEVLKFVEPYLSSRKSDSKEFKIEFEKILSDMIYSQTDDGLELLKKAKPESLYDAVFRASEIGASFSKKEISVLPFSANKKETINGVTTTKATGKYDLTVVVDIKFQKQQILAMPNCKKFFTAEVHDGVLVIHDLNTGLYIFEGTNNVSKPTIGYYACFISTDNQVYPLFMSNQEIIDRAMMNPGFKSKNYEKTSKNVHFEKIVVRNLLKEIPKISKELRSVMAYDERSEIIDTDYEDVSTKKVNSLEEAKKELADEKKQRAIEIAKGVIETANDIVKDLNNSETKNEPSVKNDAQTFF